MNIVDFLLARIAEDEEDARAADGGRWNHEDKVVTFEFWDAEHGDYDWNTMLKADTRANGWHIVNWSPDRVLAECQAKRAIVELHTPEAFADEPTQMFCQHDQRTAGVYPCETIRYLAAVHAGHPDYRDEWRP